MALSGGGFSIVYSTIIITNLDVCYLVVYVNIVTASGTRKFFAFKLYSQCNDHV